MGCPLLFSDFFSGKKDVVKRYRCGDDWGLAITKGGGCTCSQVDNYLNVYELSNLCGVHSLSHYTWTFN